MSGYDRLFQHGFSRMDAEVAHEWGFRGIRAGGRVLGAMAPTVQAPVRAMGLTFPNALGLAAGFDKNAEGIDALAGLGFGFVEIGTVTALPQPGNPKPRLMRLPADRAIVNRMGFNNDGAEVVAARLGKRANRRGRSSIPLGVNIGKSKVVSEDDEAAVLADYRRSAHLLAGYADYLVVNVSSPNTPGLRSLQAVDRLGPILTTVRAAADEAGTAVPLLVKIAPDLVDDDVSAVADLALEIGLDGIVATNTTIARTGLRSTPEEVEAAGTGGLSGAPLKSRASEVLGLLKTRVGDRLTLIGVGGIDTPADAVARLEAGADLVQAYTGFIYGGPLWPRRIARSLTTRGVSP